MKKDEWFEMITDKWCDCDELVDAAKEVRDAAKARRASPTADDLEELRDLLRSVRDKAQSMLDESWDDPEEPPEDEKERSEKGPVVVLVSDHYWARSACFDVARKNLHGEEPRVAYVTEDPKAYCDGVDGALWSKTDKSRIEIPLGRALSGERVGRPLPVRIHPAE